MNPQERIKMKTFEVGKTYSWRSVQEFTIAKRTRCFITTTDGEKVKIRYLLSDDPNREGYLYRSAEYVSLPPLYSTDGQGDEVQDCTSRFVSA